MEITGTGLDQSMFLTFETAREMARVSRKRVEKPLGIPPDSIEAVLVNVQPGSSPYALAMKIRDATRGVTPITSPELFLSFREQMTGLLRGFLIILGITWALSVVLIGLPSVPDPAAPRARRLGSARGTSKCAATEHIIEFVSAITKAKMSCKERRSG